MDSLAYVLTAGWASGVNAYAVVLVTGLLGRFGGVEGVPPALERTDVLAVAGALFVWEFVVDKIPYVDSVWDGISTVIRPVIGAAVGALLAGEAGDLSEAAGAALGGTTALASHGVKTGIRLAVNTLPEPVSNIVVSLTEDGLVAVIILLAVDHPWAALAISVTLFASGVVLVVFVFSRVRRALGRLQERTATGRAPP